MKEKSIFAILILFMIGTINLQAQIDNKTKNKIKIMYLTAEKNYKARNYSACLSKIDQIENIANGIILPTAQNLKVKALLSSKKYEKAMKELDILQGLDLSDEIINDISTYADKIEKGFEKQTALAEAHKHFTLKNCGNYCCKNRGFCVETYWKNCGHCAGKGRVEYAPFKWKTCPMSWCKNGKRKKGKRIKCTICNGLGGIYTYTGDFNFTKIELQNYVKSNKTKINNYLKTKG